MEAIKRRQVGGAVPSRCKRDEDIPPPRAAIGPLLPATSKDRLWHFVPFIVLEEVMCPLLIARGKNLCSHRRTTLEDEETELPFHSPSGLNPKPFRLEVSCAFAKPILKIPAG